MVLMLVAGFVAGGLWALVAGVLRAKLDVNEILTTLMLNYVAIFWLEHLYFGPWRDPMGMGFPGTAMFPEAAWLPRLHGTRIHLGIILALVAAILLQVGLAATRWGYEIRVIGESPRAAAYAGIPVNRTILWVMFVSGGLAGLAGMAEVAGIHYRLQQGLAVGHGYTGIIVVWLARLHPTGVLVAAIFIAGVLVGGDQLQAVMPVGTKLKRYLNYARRKHCSRRMPRTRYSRRVAPLLEGELSRGVYPLGITRRMDNTTLEQREAWLACGRKGSDASRHVTETGVG